MRFALWMVGLSRTFEYCYPSIKQHILDVYSPDVYVCMDGNDARFAELYHPVEMHIVSPEENTKAIGDRPARYKTRPTESNVAGDMSFIYKWAWCYNLMAGHGQYDVVMLCRPDVRIDKFEFDFSQGIQDKTIYLPKIDALGNKCDDDGTIYMGGWGGQLCFGTQETMRILALMYDDADKNYNDRQEWHIERVFRHHGKKYGLSDKHFDIQFRIVRDWEVK